MDLLTLSLVFGVSRRDHICVPLKPIRMRDYVTPSGDAKGSFKFTNFWGLTLYAVLFAARVQEYGFIRCAHPLAISGPGNLRFTVLHRQHPHYGTACFPIRCPGWNFAFNTGNLPFPTPPPGPSKINWPHQSSPRPTS